LSELTLDDPKKSPLQEAIDKGSTIVDGKSRKIMAGERKTKPGKESAKNAES